MREIDERGPVALQAAAEVFSLDVRRINTALAYYGEFNEEIDAEIAAAEAGQPMSGLLFTSHRTFPRSRQNPGPLVEALHAWLCKGPPPAPLTDDWLQ